MHQIGQHDRDAQARLGSAKRVQANLTAMIQQKETEKRSDHVQTDEAMSQARNELSESIMGRTEDRQDADSCVQGQRRQLDNAQAVALLCKLPVSAVPEVA